MSTGRLGAGDTAIQPTIFDAKGDLLTATAGDTPARIAVGNSGETLVADSSTTTGLRWQGDYAAGKNKIINGDFNINQRTFTSTTTSGTYGFDRWIMVATGGTVTYSSETFTLGTAPVTGYEAKNYARVITASQSAAGDRGLILQRIESVRTFANQQVTVSFWAKAASGTPKIGIEIAQDFGTGGSPSAFVSNAFGSVTLSTSWERYNVTATLASISGKTLGTNNNDFLSVALWVSAGADFATRGQSIGVQNNTFDIWGVQVEAGSVATAFQTATGTLAGELAACQRYYYLHASTLSNRAIGMGCYVSSTSAVLGFNLPVTMRATPTATVASGTDYYKLDKTPTEDWVNDFSLATTSTNRYVLLFNNTQASGTAGGAFPVFTDNASASIALSAEL